MPKQKIHILLIIVFAQFLTTSLWFAVNAVADELIVHLGYPVSSVSHLTSAIQFGFISGTLIYAILNIADRFSPSKVFFLSALFGLLANLLILIPSAPFSLALLSRILTGFFLAGIYPVGMKIAADYYDRALGGSLGFLVGALVLGTAFPHFIRAFFTDISYSYVILTTSGLALAGGLSILIFVPDGPYRKKLPNLKLGNAFKIFSKKAFRSPSFGYFGHMWELYTFYAFTPLLIGYFNKTHNCELNISLWSFIVIGVGSVGCFLTGSLSKQVYPRILSGIALTISGIMCLVAPIILQLGSIPLFTFSMILWGIAVVADSPMFSTLVANNAPSDLKGTALTLVNCIGFALTIVSIQFAELISKTINIGWVMMLLVIGPAFGLYYLFSVSSRDPEVN